MPRPGVPDPYRLKARQEGYASRAVYKLKEMDRKFHLLKPGLRVLDLGCSPGSWMQYSASKVGPSGLVLGIDRNPPEIELAPPLYFVPGEVESLDLETVKAVCPEFDVILSDLAPKTTGVKEVDRQRSLDLAFRAWEYARQLLKPGGHFLVKVFEGPDTPALVKELEAAFSACRIVKPPGSRAASREIYLLGLNKRAA
ncbi:MAG: RlmE family RNA methyltransferase [Deltaproteobacteria bacterium]|nr:RlmE family RNA methyltransferase [Deltaproteobacteria bacterium]